ncbi:MAG: [ribosomal protein S5]-alanine N-acetyltransferase [Verrucomicrobiota bacterium]
MDTKNLTLVPNEPKDLRALVKSKVDYEKSSGRRVTDGVQEFLAAGSPEYFARLNAASAVDPWNFGFAIVHKIDNCTIGFCSFTGPPSEEGVVEIAYGIAPAYEGKGYASQGAAALIDFASRHERVRTICAHTLAKTSASTRVLEKCGFRKVSETIDSENNLVWRWERSPLTS